MNRDDVQKLAKECGITFTPAGPGDDGVDAWYGNQYLPNGSLERFAASMYAKGAEDMRETCWRMAEDQDTGSRAAWAIRALPSKGERNE